MPHGYSNGRRARQHHRPLKQNLASTNSTETKFDLRPYPAPTQSQRRSKTHRTPSAGQSPLRRSHHQDFQYKCVDPQLASSARKLVGSTPSPFHSPANQSPDDSLRVVRTKRNILEQISPHSDSLEPSLGGTAHTPLLCPCRNLGVVWEIWQPFEGRWSLTQPDSLSFFPFLFVCEALGVRLESYPGSLLALWSSRVSESWRCK